jgi:hypothetical protein
MLVMVVTRKSESKKNRERYGSVQPGHHAGWTNAAGVGHQPTPSANARRPAASGLDARSMEPDPFAAMPSISCIISAHVSIRHSGGPGPTDGRDEDPGLLLVTQIGGASSFFIVLECREGRPWCV